MLVGGWYDTEDPQGLLRQHDFMQKNGPPAVNMLVMGPWNHGGFARGDGDRLGNVNFGSKTGVYYRERIELPFFLYHLKGAAMARFPRRTSSRPAPNQWRKFDSWPPASAKSTTIYLDAKASLPGSRPPHSPLHSHTMSTSRIPTSPSPTWARSARASSTAT